MKKVPAKLKKYEEYLRSTEKPAVDITFKEGGTLPWDSKCGGCPYLLDEKDYPRDKDGKPMMFLAQINLDDMPHLEDFPEHGLLQFYIGDDDIYGLDSPCKVIYVPEYERDLYGPLDDNPFENDYMGETPFTNEGKMKFKETTKFIGTNLSGFEDKFKDIPKDEYDKLYDICYPEGCFVGGYPLFVQSVSPCYEDDGYDTVLLQLDCDDDCGIMFGDGGNCVFLISKEDLKNKNFDDVYYEWQCC